jgi:hypothetical protein
MEEFKDDVSSAGAHFLGDWTKDRGIQDQRGTTLERILFVGKRRIASLCRSIIELLFLIPPFIAFVSEKGRDVACCFFTGLCCWLSKQFACHFSRQAKNLPATARITSSLILFSIIRRFVWTSIFLGAQLASVLINYEQNGTDQAVNLMRWYATPSDRQHISAQAA